MLNCIIFKCFQSCAVSFCEGVIFKINKHAVAFSFRELLNVIREQSLVLCLTFGNMAQLLDNSCRYISKPAFKITFFSILLHEVLNPVSLYCLSVLVSYAR
jgi:hypothetical protein